jgi:hypothetical protein
MNFKNIWVWVGIVVIVAAGVTVYFVFSGGDGSSVEVESVEQVSEVVTEQTQDADAQEMANLVAVGTYDGSGTATRRITDSEFIHTVDAQIADPADGKFYEGWLVDGASFFSTGKLVKSGDLYTLEYTSDEDQSDYASVVITEETEVDGLDGNPEAHVLEGSF